MGFGSKTRKIGNRFLKNVATAGTVARKTGYVMEEGGKIVTGFGVITRNPDIVEAGTGMVVAGDAAQEAGIIARKGAIGIKTRDPSKIKSAGKKMLEVLK